MPKLPQVGSDNGLWGDLLNTFLLTEHYNDANPNHADNGKLLIRLDGTVAKAQSAVQSINSKSGNSVTISAADIPFTPAGTVSSSNVQAAIQEVASEAGSSGFGNPMTTAQDIIVGGASGTAARLGVGAPGKSLVVSSSSAVVWGDVPVLANTQTSSYTLVLSDAGKSIEMNSASATTVTIPPNSSVAFPIGTILEVCRFSTGAVTLSPGSGVTLRSSGGLLTIGSQYGSISLRQRATNDWVVAGDLA